MNIHFCPTAICLASEAEHLTFCLNSLRSFITTTFYRSLDCFGWAIELAGDLFLVLLAYA